MAFGLICHFHDEWTEPPPLPAAKTALADVSAASKVGGVLELVYDGRKTNLRLKAIEIQASAKDIWACPRRKPIDALVPPSFRLHEIPSGTQCPDTLFPYLAAFLFHEAPAAELLLFRPGRKQVQAYLQRRGQVIESVFAPEKFGCVEELLFALDLGCANRVPSGHGFHWRSVSVFPSGPLSSSGNKRYAKCLEQSKPFRMRPLFGFDSLFGQGLIRDDSESEDEPLMDQLCHTIKCDDQWCAAAPALSKTFSQSFPKNAAASQGKLASQQGWIIYRNGVLKLCHGSAKKTPPTNIPYTLQAEQAFEPLDDTCVIATVERRFESLQELFCMVESLWPW